MQSAVPYHRKHEVGARWTIVTSVFLLKYLYRGYGMDVKIILVWLHFFYRARRGSQDKLVQQGREDPLAGWDYPENKEIRELKGNWWGLIIFSYDSNSFIGQHSFARQ